MKAFSKSTDDELFEKLREHVNLSRFDESKRNRPETRELAKEIKKRGILPKNIGGRS